MTSRNDGKEYSNVRNEAESIASASTSVRLQLKRRSERTFPDRMRCQAQLREQ